MSEFSETTVEPNLAINGACPWCGENPVEGTYTVPGQIGVFPRILRIKDVRTEDSPQLNCTIIVEKHVCLRCGTVFNKYKICDVVKVRNVLFDLKANLNR